MPKIPAIIWLVAKHGRQALARSFWSAYYSGMLRLHPACRQIGSLRVTGRMHWELDPRGRIEIGDKVRINSGPRVNALGGNRRTVVAVHRDALLRIGNDTGMSGCTIICQQRIEIGSDVFLGGGVLIVDSDLHGLRPEDRTPHNPASVRRAPVVVGNRTFIGADAKILKGVTIGEEAVVGAGAVVTTDVPAREIWAGNPARCVGKVPAAKGKE